MKKKIAQTLKKLRNELHYSTGYVSDSLKKFGISISPNTLYNYENGISQPSADMFLYLCKIYDVTDFSIFLDEKSSELSKSDSALLTAYHDHPEMQTAINKMLDIENKTTIQDDLQSELNPSEVFSNLINTKSN